MLTKYLSFVLLTSAIFINEVAANELTFTISSIKGGQGKIYAQLFKGENNYRTGKPNGVAMVAADSSEATLTFSHLDTGNYVVRYFHDQNDNGKMDVNLMGAPQEGYGFSNDAKPSYGPVKFDDAKFAILKSKVTNTSHVIYGE
jgi:uncharacterized protein (DUF2141 family)